MKHIKWSIRVKGHYAAPVKTVGPNLGTQMLILSFTLPDRTQLKIQQFNKFLRYSGSYYFESLFVIVFYCLIFNKSGSKC